MTQEIRSCLAPGGSLAAMAQYPHFCVYEIVPSKTRPGKFDKLPRYPTKWGDRSSLLTCAAALDKLDQLNAANDGRRWGVGYLLQEDDPFFFLDADGCLDPATRQWKPIVGELLGELPGAAYECSSSKTGVHLFGSFDYRPHSNKNAGHGLELYSSGRLAALTGLTAMGDCAKHFDLSSLIAKYFAPADKAAVDVNWEDGPCAEWSGILDDEDLIAKFLASNRMDAAAAFGGKRKLTNRELWEEDAAALSAAFPDVGGGASPWDRSSADLSLASRLAFWTGKDAPRMLRLMQESALTRDKWDLRPEYLVNTIEKAIAGCDQVYGQADETPKREVEWTDKSLDPMPCTLEPGEYTASVMSNAPAGVFGTALNEQDWPRVIRILAYQFGSNCERVLAELKQNPLFRETEESREQIALACAATDKWASGSAATLELIPEGVTLTTEKPTFGAEKQMQIFKGCAFVANHSKVHLPDGSLMDQTAFNGFMPAGVYSISDNDVVKKPWDAFLYQQKFSFPRVHDLAFRPDLPPGAIFDDEGFRYINSFVPVPSMKVQADVTPFLDHLALMLPVERDREILLAYMAAVVQNPGVKFRWAPVLQGAEGNGKGLVVTVLQKAIGTRFFHLAQSSDMGNKFNDWIVGKLLVGVNEMNLAAGGVDMIDSMKTMITDDYAAIQGKGQKQSTARIFANFIFTTNRQGAVGKAVTGRRYAVFYTAQQEDGDVARDMGNRYFRNLHKWLDQVGYNALNHYLASYPIPEQLNPATECVTAPRTSSFEASVEESKGVIEQAIEEAVAEGRIGFREPFISSHALSELMSKMHRGNAVGEKKRPALLEALGYIPHPALAAGRATKFLMPDAKKITLYVMKDHPASQLNAKDAQERYEQKNLPQPNDTLNRSAG